MLEINYASIKNFFSLGGGEKEGKKNKGTRMPYAGSLRQKWNPNESQLRGKDGATTFLGRKEGTWVTLCEESAHIVHGAQWTWRSKTMNWSSLKGRAIKKLKKKKEKVEKDLDKTRNDLGKTSIAISLLQGIFPTQGSNPGLPRCRHVVYRLSQ